MPRTGPSGRCEIATFTNFCCRASGSNLNAGTRTGDTTEPGTSSFKEYTSGTWVQATRTFTPAGGANPTTDGIAVGDFVSIYPDADTVTPYVARITTVGATTFVTSATAKSGTAPVDGVVNTTARIGGAWLGPNGTSGFPFTFLSSACTNAAGDPVRINLKNDQTSSVSAAITLASSGCTQVWGYASTYGDGGRWVLDGGTSGAAYTVLTISDGAGGTVQDIEVKNNGATGGSGVHGVNLSGVSGWMLRRCVIRDVRGNGLMQAKFSGPGNTVEECEFYGCNQSNTATHAAINTLFDAALTVNSCTIHDNTGSNTSGVYAAVPVFVRDTVFDSNQIGFTCVSNLCRLDNCDFYNNSSHGIQSTANQVVAKNCNFLKNGGYGFANASTIVATVINCGFGTGTQANTSGDVQTTAKCQQVGSITYATDVTPWTDPANGDFRISLAAAKGTGRGTFLQTAASYAGTIAYPDVGAAQHLESAGGSGGAPCAIIIGGNHGPLVTE